MEFLQTFLPILLYILGAVLLGILIYLGIKLLDTVDKVNVILDDVEDKSQQLNGLFDACENVGDTVNGVTFKVANVISKVVGTVTKVKKSRKIEEDDYDE